MVTRAQSTTHIVAYKTKGKSAVGTSNWETHRTGAWGVEAFLNFVLGGGEWLASRTIRFNPIETVPGTHFYGTRSGRCREHRKILPLLGIEPPPPCRQASL
jgi:hypothetical protein